MLDDLLNSSNTAAQAEQAKETAQTEGDDTGETVSTSMELTEEELKQISARTEKQIEDITAKKDKVTADFKAMLDAYARQEINNRTVMVSGLKYKAPSVLSGEFIIQAIKTAGPFCALGLIVCLFLMLISERRTEKRAN